MRNWRSLRACRIRPGRSRPLDCLGVAFLLLCLVMPLSTAWAQEDDLNSRAQAILSTMSVEDKVGQVFLVAFVGNDTSPGSAIAQLVQNDRVGGVVLLASNSNFYNDSDTPRQVATLANKLQELAMSGSAQVPLFIAIDHEGDGYPYTRITGGTTPLPNAMALGATWDPKNANDVGQIAGREMAAMGINMLLGPSIDVLDHPRASGQGDIGTRTFGGDPWWVGQMGRAYIEGVHEGSGGRVATVAKHFPGHGGSDRLPDEEVATVDKSIDELKRVELAPFFAVTSDDGTAEAETDALMSSHIRYLGFQGNVRQYTAPISFDAEGMNSILSLNEFSSWRPTGLIVSDSLGVPAVRKYFDPTLSTFPHRRIAKEAFLAGNNLLLLAQFDLNNVWADQLSNIRDTIAFFRDEYRTDPSFAARVDEAVLKILRLKLKLYPELTLQAVQVPADAATQVCGLGRAVTQRIASQALTLLYPDANALPAPPRSGEKILIFTDARPVRECFTSNCPSFSPLSQTAVEEAILSIYGPQGTGQIQPADITSLPFGQLKKFLTGEQVDQDLQTRLQEADWIIFAQQDLNPVKGPNSDAVKLFLDQPLVSSHDAKLVVLAFNAPYYLDTTEISKLTLYLAAYSKVEPFVREAVRALFGELMPSGTSPVDITAMNYSLQQQLAPDPDQTIPLAQVAPALNAVLLPPVSVHLEAGPILDENGHPVRDGTLVTFFAEHKDGTYEPPYTATTVRGVAEVAIALNTAGQVEFRAESGEARFSEAVSSEVQPLPTTTVEPTRTALPTATLTPADTPGSAGMVTAAPTPQNPGGTSSAGPGRRVGSQDLMLATSATLLVAVGGYSLLRKKRQRREIVVRWVLWAIVGGMSGYILYALLVIRPEIWAVLPQAGWAMKAAMVGMAAIGAVLPLPVIARTGDEHG
jgi:beta-N-acetylhexosaminidase